MCCTLYILKKLFFYRKFVSERDDLWSTRIALPFPVFNFHETSVSQNQPRRLAVVVLQQHLRGHNVVAADAAQQRVTGADELPPNWRY